jgi:hypothetical protein
MANENEGNTLFIALFFIDEPIDHRGTHHVVWSKATPLLGWSG